MHVCLRKWPSRFQFCPHHIPSWSTTRCQVYIMKNIRFYNIGNDSFSPISQALANIGLQGSFWSLFWGSLLSCRLIEVFIIIKMFTYLIFLTKGNDMSNRGVDLTHISLLFSHWDVYKVDTEFIVDYPSFLIQWPIILLSTSTSLLTRHQPRALTRSNSIHVPLQQVHQCVSKTLIPFITISRLCDFSSHTLGMLTLFITSSSHGYS